MSRCAELHAELLELETLSQPDPTPDQMPENRYQRDARLAAEANALGLTGYARDNYLGAALMAWDRANPTGGVSGHLSRDGVFTATAVGLT